MGRPVTNGDIFPGRLGPPLPPPGLHAAPAGPELLPFPEAGPGVIDLVGGFEHDLATLLGRFARSENPLGQLFGWVVEQALLREQGEITPASIVASTIANIFIIGATEPERLTRPIAFGIAHTGLLPWILERFF